MSKAIKNIKIGKYNEETNTLYPDINKLINKNRKSRKLFEEEGTIKLPLRISLLNTKDKPLNIVIENQVIPRLYTDDHRPVLFRATGNVLFKNCNIDAYRFFVSDYFIADEITNTLYSQDRYIKFENCTFTGKELQLGHLFKDIVFSNNKYTGENENITICSESRESFTFKNENIPADKKFKFVVSSSQYPLDINIKNSSFNLDCIIDSYQLYEKKSRKSSYINKINIENSNIIGNGINTYAEELNIKNSNIRGKMVNTLPIKTYIHNSTLLTDNINIDSHKFIDIKNSFIKSNNLKVNTNKLIMNVSAITTENCDIEVPKYMSLCNSNITGNNTILNINDTSFDNSKIKSNDLLLITDKNTFNSENPMFIEANTIYLKDNKVSNENSKYADINLIEPRNNLVKTLKSISEKAKEKENEEIDNFRKNNKVKKLVKKD